MRISLTTVLDIEKKLLAFYKFIDKYFEGKEIERKNFFDDIESVKLIADSNEFNTIDKHNIVLLYLVQWRMLFYFMIERLNDDIIYRRCCQDIKKSLDRSILCFPVVMEFVNLLSFYDKDYYYTEGIYTEYVNIISRIRNLEEYVIYQKFPGIEGTLVTLYCNCFRSKTGKHSWYISNRDMIYGDIISESLIEKAYQEIVNDDIL